MRSGSWLKLAAGVATFTRMFATVALLFALACSQAAEPSDDGDGCATDLSCAFGEECDHGACVPIAPGLYPHIQTASTLLRAPLDDAELVWRAQHFDLLIGGIRADDVRAVNRHARMFDYTILRYHLFDDDVKTAADWALAHGYNPEDFYLHYRVDTDVPTWESTVIVPGYPAGRVPGWNPGGPNASATSRDQSRVVGYNYHNNQPWYFANLEHPGYRAFLAQYVQGMIDGSWWNNQHNATGPIEGIMIDESIWYPSFGEGLLSRSDEYYGITVNDDHPYTYEVESTFPRLAQEMLQAFGTAKDMMPNYGHVLFLNYPNRCAQNIQATTPWAYPEVWVSHTGTSSPTSGPTRCITYDNDYVNAVRAIILQTRAGGRRVLGARDTANGPAGTDRGKMLTLGLYYLVHSKHSYYIYESATSHPTHLSTWCWNPAAQYNVGQPDVTPAAAVDFEGKPNTKEHYVFASGPDPVNAALTYRVLARRFTNALVLVKLLPAGSTIDNASITVHTLDGTYGVLQPDGLLGPAVTQASIRNNEALILIPLD